MEKYQFDSREFSIWEKSCVPMAVYQFIDRRVVTIVLSEGFCRLFHLSKDEAYDLMDNDMYRDTHPDDVVRISDAAFHFATEDCEYNVVYRTKIGSEYKIIHAFAEHIYMENGTRLAVVWYTDEGFYRPENGEYENKLQQILTQEMHQESYARKTVYDHLTGLPAMTYFFELAESGRKKLNDKGKVTAFLFIDLNGMKFFNSQYGFSEGDKLLKAMARLLAETFSNENCSRFAQDHFAVFTHAGAIEERVEQFLAGCEKINNGNNLPVRVGIYLDEMGEISVSSACDRAKAAGDMIRETYRSGYYLFNEKILESYRHHQYIVEHFEEALREHWIKVYYQPIVRSANGRVCDEEALARWIDPVLGFLSPAEFIPVLEEERLIYRLDLYMLEQILERLNDQKKRNLFLVPQSINLSRYDFESCDIVEEIRKRVDEAGIDHSMITIEVTESVIGADFEYMKKQIERFRELGFAVWMDDFGSGYSSMDVLQSVQFDLIKFDMRFMQQFDKSEKSKIILTEMMRMTMSLGLDTVMEGVETEEQVQFLREIGCRKLQGYYFCKPIPYEGILERYEKGIQIGFENPEESAYYSTVGGINLYDLSVVAHEDQESVQKYFDTTPMAVVEEDGDDYRVIRCNKSYREFIRRFFGQEPEDILAHYEENKTSPWHALMRQFRKCPEVGDCLFFTGMIKAKHIVHSFIRKVAFNQVNGKAAIVYVLLAMEDSTKQSQVSYMLIARALAADFFALYYVNMETETFTEFRSDAEEGDLAVERQGENFFEESRKDALEFIDERDREYFCFKFTKENIIRAMDEHESFTLTYRLLENGVPTYVNMKAVRMRSDSKHIIIGVNNVDSQVRQKMELERHARERETYERITALSGDFICIYTVDPETDEYTEFSATTMYEGLGLAKEGKDFFEESREAAVRAMYSGDVERFRSIFNKENILSAIQKNGFFSMQYRLMMDGRPVYVNLKAGLVREKDGDQLIIGVLNTDTQVRRELENSTETQRLSDTMKYED